MLRASFCVFALTALSAQPARAQGACSDWTDPHSKTVEMNPGGDLVGAVRGAAAGTTLLLGSGTYKVGGILQFAVTDVTLRSKSGRAEDVILDGNGGAAAPLDPSAFVNEIVAVSAGGVTIADVSIRHARHHGVHAYAPKGAPITRLRLRNVRISDCGQQLVKVNSNGSDPLYWVDSGLVECSRIGFDDNSVMEPMTGGFYTGGIDIHGGRGWVIRNNLFRNIQREGKIMEHAVHLWSKSRDCVIEGNRFEDVVRAIGLGMKTAAAGLERRYPDGQGDAPYLDFIGGMVRNNMVFNRAGIHLESGIELMNIAGTEVYHNTVVSLDAPFSSIEYRWPDTRIVLKNNLVSHSIKARDGAAAEAAANLQNAGAELFTDRVSGDLRLRVGAAGAVDKGLKLPPGAADSDMEGQARDDKPDLGADELGSGSPVRPSRRHGVMVPRNGGLRRFSLWAGLPIGRGAYLANGRQQSDQLRILPLQEARHITLEE